MQYCRRHLIGAALFLTAGCAESPTAPPAASVDPAVAKTVIAPITKMNTTAITFTPGSVLEENPPLGGVTFSKTGDYGDPDGAELSFSNIKNSGFSFLAWGPNQPNALQVTMDSFTNPLTFAGISNGVATFTGNTSAAGTSGPVYVLVRVHVQVPGLQDAGYFEDDGVPGDIGFATQITTTSFTANVWAEAKTDDGSDSNTWVPANEYYQYVHAGSPYPPVFSITFNHTFYSTYATCAPGKFFAVPMGCSDAWPGSYSEGGTVTQPTPCPEGSFQANSGQTSCDLAPAGYYVSLIGQDHANACPTGQYSTSAGSTGCTSALSGSYAAGPAATESTPCPTGSYTDHNGASSCTLAQLGHFAVGPGAKFAAACAAGTFAPSTGLSACQNAPAGYYIAGTGAVTPTKCPAGSYSDVVASTSCTPAPAGYFVASSGQTGAAQCPAGKFSTGGASSCTPAPAGSYVPDAGSSSATQCPAGYYTSTTGQTECTAAPAGSFAAGPGATEATLCPAGKYTNAEAQSSCIDAPAGSNAVGPGATQSTLCAAGSYSANAGQGSCTLAPAGSYVSGTGATGSTQCPAGKFTSTSGNVSCFDAPAGSYVGNSGATSATQCAAGYYQPSSGQTSCIAAAVGFYVPTPGATSQTICASGFTTTSIGSTSCIPLDPLFYFNSLISRADNTDGVPNGEVDKLEKAAKDYGKKGKSVCKPLDDFAKFVNDHTGTKKGNVSAANAALLLGDVRTAKTSLGCT